MTPGNSWSHLPAGVGEAPDAGVLVLAREDEVDLRGGGVLREGPRLHDDLVHVHVLLVVVPEEGHGQPLDIPVVRVGNVIRVI